MKLHCTPLTCKDTWRLLALSHFFVDVRWQLECKVLLLLFVLFVGLLVVFALRRHAGPLLGWKACGAHACLVSLGSNCVLNGVRSIGTDGVLLLLLLLLLFCCCWWWWWWWWWFVGRLHGCAWGLTSHEGGLTLLIPYSSSVGCRKWGGFRTFKIIPFQRYCSVLRGRYCCRRYHHLLRFLKFCSLVSSSHDEW